MYKKITILTAAILAALTASASAEYNKYNEQNYINFNNNTIQEVADSLEMTLEEFKAEFNLPEDMPGDTMETAAYFNLTVKDFAALQGGTADVLIEELSELTGKEITEETVYKEAEEGILFNTYLEKVEGLTPDRFGEYHAALGLTGITEETTFEEGRNQIHRTFLAENNLLGYFEKDSILVMLNGKYLDFDVAPMIINDRVMVPMRYILEPLGSIVNWDGETQTVFANKGDKIITMQIGQNYMFLNSEKLELDSPAVIVDGRTLVPVRAVAEALETKVYYNEDTKTVVIH